MTPEIKAAIQRSKTCAARQCLHEDTCYILGKETERLHLQLEALRVKLAAWSVNDPVEPDEPVPHHENTNPNLRPDWDAA